MAFGAEAAVDARVGIGWQTRRGVQVAAAIRFKAHHGQRPSFARSRGRTGQIPVVVCRQDTLGPVRCVFQGWDVGDIVRRRAWLVVFAPRPTSFRFASTPAILMVKLVEVAAADAGQVHGMGRHRDALTGQRYVDLVLVKPKSEAGNVFMTRRPAIIRFPAQVTLDALGLVEGRDAH